MTILLNPVCSEIDAIKPQVKALIADHDGMLAQHGIFNVGIVETTPDAGRNVRMAHELGRMGALGIVAGDGTESTILGGFVGQPTRWPITMFGGGHGADGAHMSHSRRNLKDITRIFERAETAELRTAQVTIMNPYGEIEVKNAAYYFTVGYSPTVARHVDQQAFRQKMKEAKQPKRFLYDASAALIEAAHIQSFEVCCPDERKLSEIAFLNGSVMAKYVRTHHSLFEDGISYAQAHNPNAASVVSVAARFAIGADKRIQLGEQYGFAINQDADVLAQIDGEVFSIPGRSRVVVTPSPHTVPVITSK